MYALLHVTAPLTWSLFSVHWSTVVGLAALGALYAWRARVEQGRGGPPLERRYVARFAIGLALTFLALNGWVHDLSDSFLFSAHMVQHLVLALLVAPLLVSGTPAWMLRPALRSSAVAAIARLITKAFPAFAIFNIVVAAWHLPPLYNLAMTYHEVHIFQHLLLLIASVIMWWPVLSPMAEFPRISYPAQMLYLFLMTIPMSVVSVSIVYTDGILYPAYASAPRVWGLSPMDDQMLGGLIMWVPGGLYFFAVISVIFFKWQKAGGLDSRASAQVDHASGSSLSTSSVG
jgi:putative membrane protein